MGFIFNVVFLFDFSYIDPNMPVFKLSDVKFDHLAAGVTGGVISTATLHPLDLIKVRLQGETKFLTTWVDRL